MRTSSTAIQELRFFLFWGHLGPVLAESVKALQYRVPECLSSRLNLVRQPPPPQATVAPPRTQVGEATLACGEGDWGIQFRRLDRHCGTLYSTVKAGNFVTFFAQINFFSQKCFKVTPKFFLVEN
jgi:hypothetical protein